MATGWLISPDVIVTAGHCVFDWSYQMGHLVEVKAYIGYNGKESVKNSKSVQFRHGARVATTAEWLRSKGLRAYDLAFIKVQEAFTGVTPIRFEDTPKSGSAILKIVAYAGDLTAKSGGEKGAHIYEMSSSTSWNLEDSDYAMLEHNMDPYNGMFSSSLL